MGGFEFCTKHPQTVIRCHKNPIIGACIHASCSVAFLSCRDPWCSYGRSKLNLTEIYIFRPTYQDPAAEREIEHLQLFT
jgi:muramidase (phage lysozyme)